MDFILVGDDFPAAQMLALLQEFDPASPRLVFTSSPDDSADKLVSRAQASGVPVHPASLLRTPAGLELLLAHPFDWLVNINSTVLLPGDLLRLPRCGALNMHPGLLPAYAGLHTHQWAIRNGETEFGSTIHFMEPRVDVGPIIVQRRFAVTDRDTGLSLFYKCIREGIAGMRQVLEEIHAGRELPRVAQDPGAYHLYRHRDALDARIDWEWPAGQVERFVRAGNYEPFRSPTYTAAFDLPDPSGAARQVEVLRVSVLQDPGRSSPGTVLRLPSADEPVAVACGAGSAVRLERLRWKLDGSLAAPADLQLLLPPGTLLCGRSRP